MEELEYVPGHYIVNQITRPRLACTCCEKVVQAEMPSCPIPKSFVGPALMAHILCCKYGYHLPLYRQSRMFENEGIDLSGSLMAGWVGKCTKLLERLSDAIRDHVFEAQAIFMDDTTVKLLQKGKGKGKNKTKTARLWVYARDETPWAGGAPPAVWYQFSTSRGAEHPSQHLATYEGFAHADAYAGYNDAYRTGRIKEMACMAHVRREFFALYESTELPVAGEAVLRFKKLHDVETHARFLPAAERVALRQEHARPIFDDLEVWLKEQLGQISGKTPLAKAISYALARLPKARPYLDHGFLEFDNNTAERAVRPVTLGRKNYLFMGLEAGGKSAAIAYILIETAKMNKVNPEAWLAWGLGRIQDHPANRIAELLPWAYQDMINARNAEAEANDAARSTVALMFTFDTLCAALKIDHRLTPPKSPQNNGMVERFNGRIEEVLQSHHFRSGEELEATLHRYVWLYNQQLPQSALDSKTPLQTMKDWHKLKPELFRKQPYYLTGCDNYRPTRLGTCMLSESRTLQGAHPELACFCSATVAGFYAAVDISGQLP